MAQPIRIFVSHSRQDTDWCRTFVEALRWSGLEVWYSDSVSKDARLSDEVERELRGRPIFIILLSPVAVVSDAVKLQYVAALHLRAARPERVILPVIVAPCALPPLLQEYSPISGADGQGLSPLDAAARVRQWLEGVELPTPGGVVPAPTEAETAHDAWERGKTMRARGLLDEALAAYSHAIALDPLQPLVWYGRGNLLHELKRYEEAVVAYDRTLELDGLLAFAWHDKGFALYSLKRYEDALLAYERALSLDPRLAPAWDHRGDALWQMERYDEALASYDAALTLAERSAQLWVKKGNALQHLARQDGRSQAPRGASHGFSFRRIRLYEQALAAYERALVLAPRSTTVWNGKIHVLEKLGRQEDAAAARRQHERANRGS